MALYCSAVIGCHTKSMPSRTVWPWWMRLWPSTQASYTCHDGSMATWPTIELSRRLLNSASWAASWPMMNSPATDRLARTHSPTRKKRVVGGHQGPRPRRRRPAGRGRSRPGPSRSGCRRPSDGMMRMTGSSDPALSEPSTESPGEAASGEAGAGPVIVMKSVIPAYRLVGRPESGIRARPRTARNERFKRAPGLPGWFDGRRRTDRAAPGSPDPGRAAGGRGGARPAPAGGVRDGGRPGQAGHHQRRLGHPPVHQAGLRRLHRRCRPPCSATWAASCARPPPASASPSRATCSTGPPTSSSTTSRPPSTTSTAPASSWPSRPWPTRPAGCWC